VHISTDTVQVQAMDDQRDKKRRLVQSSGNRRPSAPGQGGPAGAETPEARALFDRAPLAMAVVEAGGRILRTNRLFAELAGYTQDDLVGMNVDRLWSTGVPRRRPAALPRPDADTVVQEDRMLLRADRSTLDVRISVSRLDANHLEVAIHDVSTQVAKQLDLQRTVDRYDTLVNLCHVAVVSVDAEERVTAWNPAAETLFGYTAEEMIGASVTRIVPPRFREQHNAGFRRHIESPGSSSAARTLLAAGLRKDGSEVPVEVSVAVGRQEGGVVFTAVMRNVEEHRDVFDRLNDALQRLRFHIERMPLAYIVWDTEFRVVEWNAAAERMFGYARSEAVGQHAYDLVVPEDARGQVNGVWSELLSGDTSSYSLNANVRKDGTVLTCEWFNTPLRDSAGRIIGAASMAMDRTEQLAMEAQLRNTQRLESLVVLAGGVAHDFNSTLMVILGNTALLRSVKDLPDKAREFIDVIENAGLRANEFIRHLLTYARTGQHAPQSTDLNALIGDSLRFVRSSIGKEHELQLDLDPRLPEVLVDRSQVEQILLNLCLNAKQALVHDGVIRVSTRAVKLTARQVTRCVPPDVEPGPYVELAVHDNGCGMDPQTIERIFDPFFTTKETGHGLGLASVLGILRQHRGAACVESRRNRGTSLHVYFPLNTRQNPKQAHLSAESKDTGE